MKRRQVTTIKPGDPGTVQYPSGAWAWVHGEYDGQPDMSGGYDVFESFHKSISAGKRRRRRLGL